MIPPWSAVPVQQLVMPRCPFCETTEKPILVRSARTDDGAEQLCICRRCSKRFRRMFCLQILETSPVDLSFPSHHRTMES